MNASRSEIEDLTKQTQEALVTFIDFIYAVTFGFIVGQAYDTIINVDGPITEQSVMRLLLSATCFWLFAWDWIIGRVITIRCPYSGYTRVFCEIAIAACAYGTASAVFRGNTIFLLHISLIFLFGAIWAMRTEPRASDGDVRELRIMRATHFASSAMLFLFYLAWRGRPLTWSKAMQVMVIVGFLTFIYEILVDRPKGIIGGPSFPFLVRSRARFVKRIVRRIILKVA